MRQFALLVLLAVSLGGQTPLRYEIHEGYAVTRGDILLGTVAEVEAQARAGRAAAVYPPPSSRWTSGRMYYLIDPDVPNPERILAAAEHWNTRTSLRVEPYTGQANRVRFQRVSSSSVCSSFVGMRGGEQVITVPDSCSSGSLIHEIGHAFGLLHEQERADRDTWITVLPQNIEPRYLYAFDADITGSLDLAYYDYDSIMQYPSTAFARGFDDTIETVPVGIPIGQRNGLSAGDIDAVSRMYGATPSQTTITTIPAGLAITVDGAGFSSPHSFPWTPGSTHTISVAQQIGTDPQYRLVRWSDGGEATHAVTASPDRTVYAAMFQALRPVSIRSNGNGTVALAPVSDDGYYPERLPLRITAQADAGQTFFSWTGRSTVSSAGLGFATEDAVVQVSAGSGNIVGNFAAPPIVTIDSEPRGMLFLVDGVSYRAPVRLQWDGGSTHAVVALSPQSRDAGAALWSFASWSDGGAQSHAVTAPATSATFTARFRARYRLEVGLGGSGGSVTRTPASADGFYDEGTEVRLTPVGSGSNVLRYWLGDLTGGGERTIVMDAAKYVTAVFSPPAPFAIYNAASFTVNPRGALVLPVISPGEIVTLFSGDAIGPPAPLSARIENNRFTTSLGGTRVLFNGTPGALVFVAENQLSVIVPWNLTGAVTVAVERNGQIVSQTVVPLFSAFPAMFTAKASGTGQIAALNGDYSINAPGNGVPAGGVIVIYATGSGELNSSIADGAVADGNLIGVKAPVMVRIGKLPAEVIYAGSAPGIVQGAFQVNAVVPKEALADPNTPIQLIVGTFVSPPGTTIAIR